MRREALSNLALGKQIRVAHTTVARWLEGARPRGKVALKLAEFFGIPVEVLLDDASELPAGIQTTPPPERPITMAQALASVPRPVAKYATEGHLAMGHYLSMESLLDDALKRRQPGSGKEEEDFKEHLRMFTRKRARGRNAIIHATQLLELLGVTWLRNTVEGRERK